jgi:RNase P/RNase MRP subunit POP5
MKSIKPTLRENKRYLLVNKNNKDLEEAILKFIGVLGYSKAGIKFINEKIVAVNREMVNEVRASLELADIRVFKVSGTLKKLRE